MPAKKKAPVPTTAPENHSTGMMSGLGPKATIAIMVAVFAGGILLAARQPSVPKDTTPMTMSAEVTPESKTAAKKSGPSIASPEAATPAAPAAVSATLAKAAPVTLTGCLVQTDDTFRLKDTAGTAAPKTRSWKSAFMKKSPASIEVVDSAHALTLANQVGRRVSVTGTLVDREMQARSLRRVAASCDERSGV